MPDPVTPAPAPVNWAALVPDLKTIFRENLLGLLESARDDLAVDGFATVLAQYAQIAVASGDQKMMEEVRANLPWLLSFYKLKAINAANDAIFRVFTIVTGTASAFLTHLIDRIVPPVPTPAPTPNP